ncbi:MAG: Vi polysaccharide biosynthesis protein VipB/TviC [Bacteroidetes bacterium GWE2_29_8]|nr:MAG: Vi polysaccharide biosynthesis protein VipB/TviC [Bacteroidetes bacterium GWE2_29_8]OFY21930.1 MAG: Vi polysaccharide biosynthesis protein VipB/TviC [Bacteroidetes bacterium GWF2_29_10]
MFEKSFHKCDLSEYKILVTGGAGFIGSNIVDYLIKYGVGEVRVLDNLSTGYFENISMHDGLSNFVFIKEDITDYQACLEATKGIDFVIHQAALGSVPRSISNPIATNLANVNGTLNIFTSAKENNVKRIVYASSSSVYGDNALLPKQEAIIGNPLSPYAVSKYVSELYSHVFNNLYNIDIIGLRYFNVFGPKQSPEGPYAAVIPLFVNSLLKNESPIIFGDGNQTRDFTFVENAVQANIKSLFANKDLIKGKILNVALGETTSINRLFELIGDSLNIKNISPSYMPERKGDIKDSLADVSEARKSIDYETIVRIEDGINITVNWFKEYYLKG